MYAPGVVPAIDFQRLAEISAARACLWHYMAVAVRRSISSALYDAGGSKNQRGGGHF